MGKKVIPFDKSKRSVKELVEDLQGEVEELEELSSRWQVVELLNKDMPYRKISQKTGVSTTTITRIAHWLNHGEGGYEAALEKIKNLKCYKMSEKDSL